jgi:hypothetical protein
MVTHENTKTGGKAINQSPFSHVFTFLKNQIYYFNHRVMHLNNSKLFAGLIMILLNVGSKFIPIQFSRSTEEYMKLSISKQILVFAMAWMGTRDIYASLGLTIVFTVLSEHLFNEDSKLCIVPKKYRVIARLDANNDGEVSETELATAISLLEKAKREKQRKNQKEAFTKFEYMSLNNKL